MSSGKNIVFRVILNNFVVNFFIRLTGLEKRIYHNHNPYLSFVPDKKRSTQENAGYSDRPEINEVIEKSKRDLKQAVRQFCKPNDRILDVGCGPGMYLSILKDSDYDLTATDLNPAMIGLAKGLVPGGRFIVGDISELHFSEKFRFIFCIGVLIYIPRQGIRQFFRKISESLEPGGILYLNYPHALSLFDVLYNDLTYVQYSPLAIEDFIKPYFRIIKHEQAFDGRKIGRYDRKPYKSLNPATRRSYRNSSLLVAEKVH